MAMLPFCGYNIADYFDHWLEVGHSLYNPPRMFFVNWFRRDADRKFLWPGYGENMRVLKWVLDRTHGRAGGIESPLGWMPAYDDIYWEGLEEVSRAQFTELMSVERAAWIKELLSHEELFVQLYDRLPKEFVLQRELLLANLWRSPDKWQIPQG
jgi:phosphoenolpyruvate carboxykinase (GTP)